MTTRRHYDTGDFLPVPLFGVHQHASYFSYLGPTLRNPTAVGTLCVCFLFLLAPKRTGLRSCR